MYVQNPYIPTLVLQCFVIHKIMFTSVILYSAPMNPGGINIIVILVL